MKNLGRIIGTLVLMATVSCSKGPSVDKGMVTFELSNNQQITDMTKSHVSDFTNLPLVSDFVITITGADYIWTGTVSEWDESTLLPVGDYNVTATYGSLEEEGFDRPFFEGSEAFTIIGGQTTGVSVQVSLGNSVVKISCSEYFKKYYSDYTFDISRDGTPIVSFVKNETRAAFIDAYKFTISGTLNSGSKIYNFKKDYTNLNTATAYTFAFDVANVGGSSITIQFMDGYEDTIELGDYELND